MTFEQAVVAAKTGKRIRCDDSSVAIYWDHTRDCLFWDLPNPCPVIVPYPDFTEINWEVAE